MTEQERMAKRKEWQKKEAILVHSIAEQITNIQNITFQGALEVAEMVKATIERNMKQTRAHTSGEIRDRWGSVVEMPQDKNPEQRTDPNYIPCSESKNKLEIPDTGSTGHDYKKNKLENEVNITINDPVRLTPDLLARQLQSVQNGE